MDPESIPAESDFSLIADDNEPPDPVVTVSRGRDSQASAWAVPGCSILWWKLRRHIPPVVWESSGPV